MQDSRLSLHEVIFGNRKLTDVIATEKERLITLSDFREDVKTFTDLIFNFKGENVALCLENAYEFSVAFIACLYAKKVPVLLGNFTKKTIEDDKDKYDLLITSLDKDAIKNDNADAFYDRKLSADFKELASDSKIVLYTSGSTGNAKRIVKTLEVMELEATIFKNTIKSDALKGARLLATVPPYHMYGLTFRIFMPLLNRIPFEANLTHYTEELCADTYNSEEKIILVSSPAFLSRIDNAIKAPEFTLVLSAGAPFAVDDAKNFYSWAALSVTEIYGSTETNIIAFRRNDGTNPLFTTFDGVSIVRSADGFVLKSPMCPANFTLDDNLKLDGNRFLVEGRKDRIVKIAEKRVSLSQIETHLKEFSYVTDAVALTVLRNSRNFIGVVISVENAFFNTLDDSVRHDYVKALKDHLKQYVPAVAVPRYVRIVDKIPVNHMGKKLYSRLKELFDAKA